MANNLLGAFGSIVEPATVVAARNAAAQQLGDFGLPPQLNVLLPPAQAAPTQQGPTKSLATEDQQGALGGLAALWAKYKKWVLIGGALVLAVLVVAKLKK